MIGELAQVTLAKESFVNPWSGIICLGVCIIAAGFLLNNRDKGGPGSGGRELRIDEGQPVGRDRRPRLIAA